MKPLKLSDTHLVSGGEQLSCVDALIMDLIFEDENINFSHFCTKNQTSILATSFIDLIYTPSFIESSEALQALYIIQWLGNQTA